MPPVAPLPVFRLTETLLASSALLFCRSVVVTPPALVNWFLLSVTALSVLVI